MALKAALCLTAAWIALAHPGMGAAAYTVGDLVRTAIESNRELEALRRRVDEARGLLRQAGARPAPNLEVGASTGKPLGSAGEEEFSAGFAQTLETAGKRGKRMSVAEKGVALAEAELAERTRHLVIEIKLGRLEALTEQAKLDALDQILESYGESLKLTEARVGQGDAAPLESQLLLVEVNRTEALKRTIAGKVQVALAILRRLCGIGVSEPLTLSPDAAAAPGGVYDLAELRRRALELRPDLRMARIVEQQGAAEIALTEAGSRGDVTLSAQYALRNAQIARLRDRDHLLAFGVSVPLFTKRRNLGNLEAAAARATGARSMRQHLEAAIPLEVEAAWQHWEAARQSLAWLERGVVALSEKNLDIMRQAQVLGQVRLLDVLNEQRRLVETRMGAIEAGAEVRRGAIELEQAVGGDLK
ncbi:MAG: TolC family protein [Acidobacteria bacterium]|nr:TolC family protein [Acidobacteriota bacterium]